MAKLTKYLNVQGNEYVAAVFDSRILEVINKDYTVIINIYLGSGDNAFHSCIDNKSQSATTEKLSKYLPLLTSYDPKMRADTWFRVARNLIEDYLVECADHREFMALLESKS